MQDLAFRKTLTAAFWTLSVLLEGKSEYDCLAVNDVAGYGFLPGLNSF